MSKQDAKVGQTLPRARQDAFLALIRAHDVLVRQTQDLMKGFGVSPSQYNVLRILRGAGEEGKPSQSIAEDMISQVPDVSRLVSRLVAAGLASRCADSDDRRIVRVLITSQGLAMLTAMDRPVADLHSTVLGVMSPKELRQLVGLLEKI